MVKEFYIQELKDELEKYQTFLESRKDYLLKKQKEDEDSDRDDSIISRLNNEEASDNISENDSEQGPTSLSTDVIDGEDDRRDSTTPRLNNEEANDNASENGSVQSLILSTDIIENELRIVEVQLEIVKENSQLIEESTLHIGLFLKNLDSDFQEHLLKSMLYRQAYNFFLKMMLLSKSKIEHLLISGDIFLSSDVTSYLKNNHKIKTLTLKGNAEVRNIIISKEFFEALTLANNLYLIEVLDDYNLPANSCMESIVNRLKSLPRNREVLLSWSWRERSNEDARNCNIIDFNIPFYMSCQINTDKAKLELWSHIMGRVIFTKYKGNIRIDINSHKCPENLLANNEFKNKLSDQFNLFLIFEELYRGKLGQYKIVTAILEQTKKAFYYEPKKLLATKQLIEDNCEKFYEISSPNNIEKLTWSILFDAPEKKLIINFYEKLDNQGFEILNLNGDIYESVGFCIEKDKAELRQTVIKYFQHNPEKFYHLFAQEKDCKDYILNLQKGINSSKHIEIKILERVLNRPIIIINQDGIIENLSAAQREQNRIFLYKHGGFYSALRLITGTNINEILSDAQRRIEHASKGFLHWLRKAFIKHSCFLYYNRNVFSLNGNFDSDFSCSSLFNMKINCLPLLMEDLRQLDHTAEFNHYRLIDYAVKNDDILAIKFLISAGSDKILEKKNTQGLRPLDYAAIFASPEAIAGILNVKNIHAIEELDSDRVYLLEMQDGEGNTPLLNAAKYGKKENIIFLLKLGANPKKVNNKINKCDSAGSLALENKHYECAEILFRAGSPFPLLTSYKTIFPASLEKLIIFYQEIERLIIQGNLEAIKQLVEKSELTSDFHSLENHSAKYIAIKEKQFEIYAYLLSRGFDFYENKEEEIINELPYHDKMQLESMIYDYLHGYEQSIVVYLLLHSKIKQKEQRYFEVIKTIYTQLYAIPEVKIVMQMLEITQSKINILFDFQKNNIHEIAPTSGKKSLGASDPNGRIYIGANCNIEELMGVVAHELTHHAMRVMFKNDCKPYPCNDEESCKKLEIIINDLFIKFQIARRKEGKYILESPRNDKVNIRQYLDKGNDENNFALLDPIITRVFEGYEEDKWEAEIIVRVPHMLAKFECIKGRKILLEQCKQLFDFFNEVSKNFEEYIKSNKKNKTDDSILSSSSKMFSIGGGGSTIFPKFIFRFGSKIKPILPLFFKASVKQNSSIKRGNNNQIIQIAIDGKGLAFSTFIVTTGWLFNEELKRRHSTTDIRNDDLATKAKN